MTGNGKSDTVAGSSPPPAPLVVAVGDADGRVRLQLARVVGSGRCCRRTSVSLNVDLTSASSVVVDGLPGKTVKRRCRSSWRAAVRVRRADGQVVGAQRGRAARAERSGGPCCAVRGGAGPVGRHERHAQRGRGLRAAGSRAARWPWTSTACWKVGPVDPVDRADRDRAERAEPHRVEAPLVALAGRAVGDALRRRRARVLVVERARRAPRARRDEDCAARRGRRSASRCRSRCARSRPARSDRAGGAGPSGRSRTSRPGRRCRGGRRGCWARCRSRSRRARRRRARRPAPA